MVPWPVGCVVPVGVAGRGLFATAGGVRVVAGVRDGAGAGVGGGAFAVSCFAVSGAVAAGVESTGVGTGAAGGFAATVVGCGAALCMSRYAPRPPPTSTSVAAI